MVFQQQGPWRALRLEAVALRAQCQLPIGHHFIRLILQQTRHISVGDAVVIAAEADVVLFQLNGPERGIEFAVLVLPVHVDASHKAQQQHHHQDDDSQDDDVELGPGNVGQGCRGVVCGAAHAAQRGLGGRCGAQRSTDRTHRPGHGCDSCFGRSGAARRGECARSRGLGNGSGY